MKYHHALLGKGYLPVTAETGWRVHDSFFVEQTEDALNDVMELDAEGKALALLHNLAQTFADPLLIPDCSIGARLSCQIAAARERHLEGKTNSSGSLVKQMSSRSRSSSKVLSHWSETCCRSNSVVSCL